MLDIARNRSSLFLRSVYQQNANVTPRTLGGYSQNIYIFLMQALASTELT